MPLNVTRCIPFHCSISSLPYTTSVYQRATCQEQRESGCITHFRGLRRARSLRAVRGRGSFWGGRARSRFHMLRRFRGQTHILLSMHSLPSSILSTTISCHLTFGRKWLAPFVEERDVYNAVSLFSRTASWPRMRIYTCNYFVLVIGLPGGLAAFSLSTDQRKH